MPESKTMQRAQKKEREGKAPTTQAGEFVREEMEHAKSGKHDVKNNKQAIAIGLSKARRSGVNVPRKGSKTKKKTGTATRAGRAEGARGEQRKAARRPKPKAATSRAGRGAGRQAARTGRRAKSSRKA